MFLASNYVPSVGQSKSGLRMGKRLRSSSVSAPRPPEATHLLAVYVLRGGKGSLGWVHVVAGRAFVSGACSRCRYDCAVTTGPCRLPLPLGSNCLLIRSGTLSTLLAALQQRVSEATTAHFNGDRRHYYHARRPQLTSLAVSLGLHHPNLHRRDD
jgi:hypothetical protein